MLSGFPPNVDPCMPGVNNSAARPRATTAPIGIPPPSPLASITRSG